MHLLEFGVKAYAAFVIAAEVSKIQPAGVGYRIVTFLFENVAH